MINNLRWIGALGAVYVACAAVGTAQAAGPDDRAEARGPGAIAARRSTASTAWATARSVAQLGASGPTGSAR